jgi:hypothetical protein
MRNKLIFTAVLVAIGFTGINYFMGHLTPHLSAFETPKNSTALALTEAIITHGHKRSGE